MFKAAFSHVTGLKKGHGKYTVVLKMNLLLLLTEICDFSLDCAFPYGDNKDLRYL